MNKDLEAIQGKYYELVEAIQEYESDTFSASGSGITEKEACKIASIFICRDIQRRTDTQTMDGVMIGEELSELRD